MNLVSGIHQDLVLILSSRQNSSGCRRVLPPGWVWRGSEQIRGLGGGSEKAGQRPAFRQLESVSSEILSSLLLSSSSSSPSLACPRGTRSRSEARPVVKMNYYTTISIFIEFYCIINARLQQLCSLQIGWPSFDCWDEKYENVTLVSRYLAFLVRMVTLRLSGFSLSSISITNSGLCSVTHQSPVRMSEGA